MMRGVWLGGLLSIACATTGKGQAAQVSPVAEYYPLAVGNTWAYEGTMLGGPAKFDIHILSEDQGRFTDSQQNVLRVDGFGIRDEKRYLLRTPLEVGTKWNNVVSISSYEQYSIIEAGQACDAPAGAFKGCVVVESRNKDEGSRLLVATLTFAPRVGLVRIETVLEENGKRIPQSRIELVKYELKGAAQPSP
ncbi:MAG: hypothetical protein JNK82_41975 [Myxococcaceae bacterium]|nr:hypothetical protein [Myxococcaceae bacterium]